MAEIILTANPLAPPACGYASEQERLDAYVDAIGAELVGGIEWQASVDEPSDLSLHWLKLDADGRQVSALEYSDADARYVRWISMPTSDGIPAGAGGVFTLTFTPSFNVATAQQQGRRYVFVSNHTITGAATLNIDGTGALDIVKHGGLPLENGDIQSGQIVDVIISGGDAWLQTPPGPPQPDTTTAAIVKYTGATGTAPQSIPAGVETSVQWNSTVDPDSIVTLSSTQFELLTGKYLIDIAVPVNATSPPADIVLLLYDATGATIIATNTNLVDADDETTWAFIKHVVVVTAASNDYEVKFYSNAAVTLGVVSSVGTYDETYQQMSIIQL